MKNFLTLFTCFVLNVPLTGEEIDVPYISVSGTAVLKVVPDEMHWMLDVGTVRPTVEAVAKEHDKRVAEVLGFLKAQEIELEKTQTSQIRISDHYVERGRNYVKEGYEASTTVTFESNNIESYRDLWIGVSKLEGIEVDFVSFDTSERIKFQNESRLKAAEEAKKKARALAEALGARVREPLIITEDLSVNEGNRSRNMLSNFAGASGESNETSSSVSPGMIAVSSRVNVTFRISSN